MGKLRRRKVKGWCRVHASTCVCGPIAWATQDVTRDAELSDRQFSSWPFSRGPPAWTGLLGTKGLTCWRQRLGGEEEEGEKEGEGCSGGCAGSGFLATAPTSPCRQGPGAILCPVAPFGWLWRGTAPHRSCLGILDPERAQEVSAGRGDAHPGPRQGLHCPRPSHWPASPLPAAGSPLSGLAPSRQGAELVLLSLQHLRLLSVTPALSHSPSP